MRKSIKKNRAVLVYKKNLTFRYTNIQCLYLNKKVFPLLKKLMKGTSLD